MRQKLILTPYVPFRHHTSPDHQPRSDRSDDDRDDTKKETPPFSSELLAGLDRSQKKRHSMKRTKNIFHMGTTLNDASSLGWRSFSLSPTLCMPRRVVYTRTSCCNGERRKVHEANLPMNCPSKHASSQRFQADSLPHMQPSCQGQLPIRW